MKINKIRISVVTTFRITDCAPDLITYIDRICIKNKWSRVQFIENLWGNKIEGKADVKRLQQFVKEQGYKTIEKWLRAKIQGEEYGKKI